MSDFDIGKETEYDIHALRISEDVDSKTGRKKGIVPGTYITTIKHVGMIAPGSTITVKGKKRRVRCVDCLTNKRIVIVEGV